MQLTGVASPNEAGRGGGRRAGTGRTSLPLVVALTSVAFFIVALDQLVVTTALPAIHHSIGGSIDTLEWTVNSYALTTATPMLVVPAAGALADRIGSRPLMVTGLAMQAAGLAWVADVAATGGGYGRFVAPLIIAGVGISMAIPTSPAAALGAVPRADTGRASGVNNTLQRFGGAFGVAAATAVFSAYGHLGSPAAVISGYRPALAVSAGLSLLGAVAAVFAGRRVPAPAPVPGRTAGAAAPQHTADAPVPERAAGGRDGGDHATAVRLDRTGLETARS